jgi:quercetin dioxygenase-like cupin family protein
MIIRYAAVPFALLVLAGAAQAQTTPPAAAPSAAAPSPKLPTTRIDLQRHDLSASGREVIQARIDFGPGIFAPMHTHPGEEIIYVLEGTLEYEIKGKPPVTLKPGDVLFVPAGAAHSARNLGNGKASELATYIVEKGKPLLALAK